jgi:hypothetical protein
MRGHYTADEILDGYNLVYLVLDTRGCDERFRSNDLLLENGRVAMIVHMAFPNSLSFARVGDTRWTWIDVHQSCSDYSNVFYNDSDNLFYASRYSGGEVHTVDINGTSPVVKVIVGQIKYSSSRYDNHYIVVAPWGAILQVWRNNVPMRRGEYRKLGLNVYTVDLCRQKLIRINNLQDHVLFIGFNTPFFLPSKDFPMLTPNFFFQPGFHPFPLLERK